MASDIVMLKQLQSCLPNDMKCFSNSITNCVHLGIAVAILKKMEFADEIIMSKNLIIQ